MKLKKIFQNLFKKIFQNIFIIIYGKIKVLDDDHKYFFKTNKIDKININGKNYEVDKNVYEIENARVYTDLVEHVAIIKDNFIIPKISYQQINNELKDLSYNKVLLSGTNRFHQGGIACCQIYNKALTAKEVKHNFDIQRTRFGI